MPYGSYGPMRPDSESVSECSELSRVAEMSAYNIR